MSHDERSGTATRKERRKAYGGKRQAAPRYVFSAEAHVRKDWTVPDVIEHLEDRAKGYNGILRQLLCTSAAIMRMAVDVGALHPVQANNEALKAEMAEAPIILSPDAEKLAESRGMIVGTSKRNQQPGRLSGGERAALEKFVTAARYGADSHEETMAAGRALLAKVRKRALGDAAEETVDASALMPVGVEEG